MIVYGALKDKLKSCPLHDNSRNCHEIVLMWDKERWRGTFHVQTEPLTVRQIFSKMKILLSKGKTCSRSTNMTLIKPIAVTSQLDAWGGVRWGHPENALLSLNWQLKVRSDCLFPEFPSQSLSPQWSDDIITAPLQKCLFGGVPESSFQTKSSVAAKTAAVALKQLCYI